MKRQSENAEQRTPLRLRLILIRRWLGIAGLGVSCWLVASAANCAEQDGSDHTLAFRTTILPILTKAGCNAGACHGGATGQGGFKLSLLGYDPEEDYNRITREFGGRRLDMDVPASSLLLRKPTRQLSHEGGRRILRDSHEYQTVLCWITAGAPYGPPDLAVARIAVAPEESLMAATNQLLRLCTTAFLTDGSQQDVTPLALYGSNDDTIAEVSKTGEVTTRAPGLTTITVRYSGQVAAARITLPFAQAKPEQADFQVYNLIDQHIGAELGRLRLPFSPLSSDAEFLRRIYLDVIGRLPLLEEARAFLGESGSTARRQKVIESLLQREEFIDLWTMRLADLLLVSGRRGGEAATRAYHQWVRSAVAQNLRLDEFARTLLTATGDLTSVGAANFFNLAADPRDLAEQAGRIFLGTQIGCARCHAHPTDRWTQEDYYQFAAFFARVSNDGERISLKTRGEVTHPKSGRPLSPKPLGAPICQKPDSEDRRIQLATWLTAPENPLFARSIVNRLWKHLLGRGLVEPVDDLRPTNPPTHPALLNDLAAEFVRSGYDLRGLIRMIVSSRTYQLSSVACGRNRLDDRFYSHALSKELPAQVFLDAVAQVTGIADQFEGYPPGTRAVQLIGSSTASYALDVLGRCPRDRACDSPGYSGGGLAQALHLINGPTINDKLKAGLIQQLLGLSDHEIIEDVYLRAFTRLPNAQELAEWQSLLARPSKLEAVQDFVWAVLNSREFAFTH